MKNNQLLINGLCELGIQVSDNMIDQFSKYYEMLIEWNQKINLTAITEEVEVIQKHFLDSVLSIKEFDFSRVDQMIDVGTGAGFPAIPLKIIHPQLKIVLLDSLNKRIQFLNTVADHLELKAIECIHSRAEDLAKQKDYRGAFDVCVSRAVSNLSTLSEYCLPFVKNEGCFIAYKSENSGEEIELAKKAISVLGGNIQSIQNYKIPTTNITRTIVKIQKVKETPNAYPRKAGKPLKKPL